MYGIAPAAINAKLPTAILRVPSDILNGISLPATIILPILTYISSVVYLAAATISAISPTVIAPIPSLTELGICPSVPCQGSTSCIYSIFTDLFYCCKHERNEKFTKSLDGYRVFSFANQHLQQ